MSAKPTKTLRLNSEEIQGFLNETSTYIPINETLYYHTHPLLRPNFLTDFQAIAEVFIKSLATNHVPHGAPVDRLQSAVIGLVKATEGMDKGSKDSTEVFLKNMREAYQIIIRMAPQIVGNKPS